MITRDPCAARRLGLSAVLPAYNEEALLGTTVCHVARVLRELVDHFEIVVVDDGSRDGTPDVLRRLQAEQPDLPLRVVTHAVNQGYGAALASGFDASRNELVVMLDADGQFDVAELVHFLRALDDSTDMVIGWRAHRADPFMRTVNARGWKLLIGTLFGYTARDVDCAFKLFRRRVWEEMTVQARGATFSAEFLIKARRLGFRVKELPVSHFPRRAGSPTGAHPKVIARAFKELLELRVNLEHDLSTDRHVTTGRLAQVHR
jgi:glycosyltransferase involved in cell wall biosynthesis